MNLVRKYDTEFPQKYFYDFLKYVDIDEKNFGKLLMITDHLTFGIMIKKVKIGN